MNTILKPLVFLKLNQFVWPSYAIVLILLVSTVYLNSTTNGYNYDDTLVTQNQPLTSNASLSSIRTIFSGSYYKDDMGYSFGYRPMVLLSFALEHSLLSENPMVSHIFNFLLYVGVVLLLFKLLHKFLGEDKIAIAFLAALLFAVHPVHTEAVASIKNRDELLAFLFVMLSGIMAFKYLDKKSWYTLLFSGLFFAAGMLSKKSVYPLAFILPIGFIFFKEIGIKPLLILLLTFLIPAALIGSDLEILKMVQLLVFPLVFVLLVYLYNNRKKQDSNSKLDFIKECLLHLLSWFFIGLAIYKINFGFVFLGFILLYFSKLEKSKTSFQILLQLILVGYFFKNFDCFMIAFLISTAFTIHSLLNKKAAVLNSLITITSIIGLIYIDSSLNKLILVFFVGLFYVTSFKYRKISLLLSGINCIVSLVFFRIGLFQIALLTFSIFLNIAFLKTYFITYMKSGLFLAVFISLVYVSFEVNFPNNFLKTLTVTSGGQLENTNQYLKNLSSKKAISEGRSLEYMENTLVAPHSVNEKVATGIVVLGEYARLMIFPNELSFYYGYSKIKTTNFNDFRVWTYLLMYLSVGFVGVYQINKRPILSFGIAWYILSILLFSNWIELVAGMVGERLAFTASAGFCILIASLIYEFKPSFNLAKPKKLEFVVVLVLLLFSVRSFSRNKDWQGPVKLMSHDIVHLETSAQANNMLALSLMNESLTNPILSAETKIEYRKKAVGYFSKAIAIYPYFFNYHFDLGRANIVLHNYEIAKKAFIQAYKLQPKNMLSLEELTKVCFDLKQKEDTVYYGNLYLEINPTNEKIQEFVAYICLLNKDFVSAKKYAERGLSYFPNNENFKHMIIDSSK